jgi:hypothetical protein
MCKVYYNHHNMMDMRQFTYIGHYTRYRTRQECVKYINLPMWCMYDGGINPKCTWIYLTNERDFITYSYQMPPYQWIFNWLISHVSWFQTRKRKVQRWHLLNDLWHVFMLSQVMTILSHTISINNNLGF